MATLAAEMKSATAAGNGCTQSSGSDSKGRSVAPGREFAGKFGVEIADDSQLGRCAVAARDFPAGSVIFKENPCIFATWDPEDSGDTVREMVGPSLTGGAMREIEKAMAEIEGIGELDRARQLILALQKAAQDRSMRARLLSLCTANLDLATSAVEKCFQDPNLSRVFPQEITKEEAARILSALNTNSHELEQLGGSALYAEIGCFLNHSCDPNCTFNTHNGVLWVVNTKALAVGDHLTIDYGNFFYEPREDRQQTLLESYGFECRCQKCQEGRDTARAFYCAACAGGAVVPHYHKGEIKCWQCINCESVCDSRKIAILERIEAAFGDSEPPARVEDVDKIIGQKTLHSTHFLLWSTLRYLGQNFAGNPFRCRNGSAAAVWKRVIATAEQVLPTRHPEKVALYDALAQIFIASGDTEKASKAFFQAHRESVACAGSETPPTLLLKKLAENPPKSVEDLRKCYSNP